MMQEYIVLLFGTVTFDTAYTLYFCYVVGAITNSLMQIFKIQVFHQPSGEHWFVFRRYTDFVRLNKSVSECSHVS